MITVITETNPGETWRKEFIQSWKMFDVCAAISPDVYTRSGHRNMHEDEVKGRTLLRETWPWPHQCETAGPQSLFLLVPQYVCVCARCGCVCGLSLYISQIPALNHIKPMQYQANWENSLICPVRSGLHDGLPSLSSPRPFPLSPAALSTGQTGTGRPRRSRAPRWTVRTAGWWCPTGSVCQTLSHTTPLRGRCAGRMQVHAPTCHAWISSAGQSQESVI